MSKAFSPFALAALMLAIPAVQAQEVPVLRGSWASTALESYGNHYATRTFNFTETSWTVVFRAYADAQGKQPLFRLNAGGVYVLGQSSATVRGAFEGIFPATYRHITAESNAGVHLFSSMGCSLVKDQETPLVNQGCGFVPGIMQAMGEYDLVAFKEGEVYFGDRGGDLTKSRPTSLTPYPVTHQ